MAIKTLFICKNNPSNPCSDYSTIRRFSGLFNSARFVSKMLEKNGIESKVVISIDNNGIDKLVTEYKPDVVFIEALWVVPEKFAVLRNLHPNVTWVIRLHSQLPFLAQEGSAFGWITEYLKEDNVIIAPNTAELTDTLKHMYRDLEVDLSSKIRFLPNYYDVDAANGVESDVLPRQNHIHVGCFGAIRPLKNQMSQAAAAILFANRQGYTLHFHINGNRVEQNGDSNLKNIRSLFEAQDRHELIEHDWMPHKDFLTLVKSMDMGMQVSYTESFNIVSADFAACNVPLVTSDEVPWTSSLFWASPSSVHDIVRNLEFAWTWRWLNLQYFNRRGLIKYVTSSERIWVRFLNHSELSDQIANRER